MTGKLTTVVVIDVDNFSALARTNKDAAIAAVARLHERANQVAAAHGGRVFNVSGDAASMEFASVAGGVAAAAELAANPDPPIRVGVHFGEVTPMPNGDLLGPGVGVATQLQALARAGHVMVSDNVHRALRGPLARRLVAKGSAKLDKGSEPSHIYELAQASGDEPPPRRRLMIVGGAVLTAIVAIALLWPALKSKPETRVAVFSLAAPADDGALQAIGSGVADDVTRALGAAGVHTLDRGELTGATPEARLARAKQHGATFALDGATARNAGQLHVDVRILNANDRTALWTGVFDAPSQDAATLRLNAAAQSTALLRCAVRATRASRLSNDTLTLLLRGCAAMNIDGRMQEAHDAFAQVAARESGLAYARGLLAVASVEMSFTAPDTQREQFRGEARMQAERARRADPKTGESYLALERLEARDAWAQREGLLREGLENDERNAELNEDYAGLLLDVGRLREALAHAQRAAALDPLPPVRSYPVAGAMLAAGDVEGARALTERIAQAWPNEPNLWALRFSTAFWGERYDEAEALLTAPTSRARTPAARQCWRDAANAVRVSDTRARRAGAQRAMACLRAGNLPGIQTLMLVASLGDAEQAFALARELYVDQHRPGLDALFVPQTQSLRSDPRFMPLMNDLGLLRYWDLNNNWPDFCREPRLPYRCEAEARRLLRGH